MLVALSGGADSVALLLYLIEQGKAEAAAHCNFHLRGEESNRDEAFVRQLCRNQGVPLYVAHFDTEARAAEAGESIEMAARRLRYDWFAQLCSEHSFDAVAVAHHRDDNAETLLLNLIRGTGLHGLTGIAAERPGVVRPLIDWSRRDILDYLARRGQQYVTDSTNTDTRYRRNKVRHEVIPLLRQLNPQIDRTLHETARRLTEAETIYRYGLKALLGKVVSRSADAPCWNADVAALEATPARATLLHEWLSPYGFSGEQVREALILSVGALLEAGEWLLTRTTHSLQLRQKPRQLAPVLLPEIDSLLFAGSKGLIAEVNGLRIGYETILRDEHFVIPREPNRVALDADSLCGRLYLRSVCMGDRFSPFGLKGTQLVSNYLTNRHRSRIEKMAALAVADEAGMVWLVNERPDSRVAVKPSTRRILILYSEKL